MIKRILMSIPIFFIITIVVFVLSDLVPGSAVDTLASSGEMTEEAYRAMEIELGLDKPAFMRYGLWLWDLLHGDLGRSVLTNTPVAFLIAQRIGYSLLICAAGIIFAIIISIPLGVAAACKPYSVWDHLSSVISFVGVSLPNFFFCMILIYIFAVELGILPAQGVHSSNLTTTADLIRHMILPSVAICFLNVGTFIKQTRGSVLEVLNEEYIKTARSKGLKEITIIIKHTLRNALIPIVTTIGMTVPMIVGGAIVTEQVFSWPGMGSLLIHSITTRDFIVTMGCTIVISLTVLVLNILLDILYVWLDPRIKKDV